MVTQNPPVLTLSKGQTATLDCNLDTNTDSAARWYKQIYGGVPQFVLVFYHPNSSPTYGSGYSSPKFNSNHKTKSDYRLIVSNVDVDDSAVYYCYTWDSSAKEDVSQWFTAWQKPPHCSHSLLLSACRLCHIRYCMIYEYNQTHLHRADSNSRCFLCVRTEENLHRSLRLIEDELQRSVFRSIQKIH